MVKSLLAKAGDVRGASLIPGSGRSPREGNGNPPQYSCLENSVDSGAWWGTVQGVTKESDMTERLNSYKSLSPLPAPPPDLEFIEDR